MRLRPKSRELESCLRPHDAVNDDVKQGSPPQQMGVSREMIDRCFTCRPAGSCAPISRLPSRQAGRAECPGPRTTVARDAIRDMVNTSERPAEAADPAVPGFWEGDLIISGGQQVTSKWSTGTWRISAMARGA